MQLMATVFRFFSCIHGFNIPPPPPLDGGGEAEDAAAAVQV